MFINNNK